MVDVIELVIIVLQCAVLVQRSLALVVAQRAKITAQQLVNWVVINNSRIIDV